MPDCPTRRIFCLLFLLFTTIHTYGQNRLDTLWWHEGVQLQADDFRKKSPNLELGIFHQYQYTIYLEKYKRFRPVIKNHVVFHREKSSRGENFSRDDLRLAQTLFDLAGYQERKVRVTIAEMDLVSPDQEFLQQSVEQVFYNADLEMDKLKDSLLAELSASPEFQRDIVFQRWQQSIKEDLEALPQIKTTKSEQHSIGIHVGTGGTILTGKTGRYFTSPIHMQLGFDLNFVKHRFGVDFRLGPNRTKAPLEGNGNWDSGEKSTLTCIELTYGYIFPQHNSKIVPFAGLSVNIFTPRTNDKEDNRNVTGYAPVVGLGYMRIFKEQEAYLANQYFQLNLKLSYCPYNFIRNYSGGVVNLSAAFGVFYQKIKSTTTLVR